VSRTNPIKVGNSELSLIVAPLAKDDVARLEDDLAGLNIACIAAAPNLQ